MTWEWVVLISVFLIFILVGAGLVFAVWFHTQGFKEKEDETETLIQGLASLSQRIHKVEKDAEDAKKFISQQNLAQGLRIGRS